MKRGKAEKDPARIRNKKKQPFRSVTADPKDYSGPLEQYFLPRLRHLIDNYAYARNEEENKRLIELKNIVGATQKDFTFLSAVASSYNDYYNFLLDFRIKWVQDMEQNAELVRALVNWVMYDEVQIRESTIPNAGYGLFTTTKFKKTDGIVVYGGIVMYDNVYDYGGPPPNAYVITVGSDDHPVADGLTVDGFRGFKLSEPGRWANSFQDASKNNAQFETVWVPKTKSFEVRVVATRDIEAGEEIFVTYGNIYDWSFSYAACTQCEAPEAPYMCGKCKQVRYCDAKCQKLHWKDHKTKCIGF